MKRETPPHLWFSEDEQGTFKPLPAGPLLWVGIILAGIGRLFKRSPPTVYDTYSVRNHPNVVHDSFWQKKYARFLELYKKQPSELTTYEAQERNFLEKFLLSDYYIP